MLWGNSTSHAYWWLHLHNYQYVRPFTVKEKQQKWTNYALFMTLHVTTYKAAITTQEISQQQTKHTHTQIHT